MNTASGKPLLTNLSATYPSIKNSNQINKLNSSQKFKIWVLIKKNLLFFLLPHLGLVGETQKFGRRIETVGQVCVLFDWGLEG